MFTDTTGQIQSKTCGAGKYQDQPGNTECKKVGVLSRAMCLFFKIFLLHLTQTFPPSMQCPAGRFNTAGTGTVNLHDELSDCTECVKGQYQTGMGSTGCTSF